MFGAPPFKRRLGSRGVEYDTSDLAEKEKNSCATYALAFHSLGEVAKAMGDAEGIVKRYYTETLEPGTSKSWFKVQLARVTD
jgi:hypothetical protein